jgi:soluble lytic murein transglycosylase-like protein
MDALIQQESGGNPTAVGPQTKYGQALGSTQMLPSTAKQMAKKLGLPFKPEWLQSSDPQAASYQRQLGEAYLKEGLEKTGNVRDALHYYHGGPNRSLWGPKTKAYSNAVLRRLR